MDRRKQKTRHAIYEAFSTLLSQKKYSQITIQEIIDTANIGRSTFYAHFPAKEDLLREICTELFEHIFYYSPLPEEETPPQQEEENIQRVLAHILTHMARNGKMIHGILSSESGSFFIACLREYMDEFTDRYILRQRKNELKGISLDFFKNHISGSFIAAIQWWFDHGSQPDAQDLARQYTKLIVPILP